ncbi:MAG TPA: hypothetical protein VGN96_15765 [Roseococcus sp.]|jgi:hypothetical protein|nr:hypothetical protein [Roseococcus sp.]
MALVVLTAATVRELTTLAAVKARLDVHGFEDDPFLNAEIKRQTGVALSYLRVQEAQDGSRTLARETLREDVWPEPGTHRIRLSRTPVAAVVSVIEAGATLSADDFAIDAPSGVLRRLSADAPRCWQGAKVVVEYEAGWLLPGVASPLAPNLPAEIETAVIEMVKAAREARGRDPMLRSESVQGVGAVSYLDPARGAEDMPPQAAALLAPYRMLRA